jgi:hypothetical protein
MTFREIVNKVSLKQPHSAFFLAVGIGAAVGLTLLLGACGPRTEPTNANPSTPSANASTGANSQEVLAAVFNASSENLFEAKTSADLGKCRVFQQCELVPGDEGLKVIATGDDAAIFLPSFAEDKRFVLQVIIDSPVDSGIQLFHMVRGQKEYQEAKAPIYPIRKGINTIYFRVDDAKTIDPLRLDPSFKSGEYTIKSIIARPVVAPATY